MKSPHTPTPNTSELEATTQSAVQAIIAKAKTFETKEQWEAFIDSCVHNAIATGTDDEMTRLIHQTASAVAEFKATSSQIQTRKE